MEIAANSHHSRLNIAEGEKLWPRITATMGRVAAMLLLLGAIVVVLLVTLALFSVAPMFCCCFAALLYILACFIINEAGGMHHAQEFENRFWTVFAVLMATAIIFVRDSVRPYCAHAVITHHDQYTFLDMNLSSWISLLSSWMSLSVGSIFLASLLWGHTAGTWNFHCVHFWFFCPHV